jgi:Putative phage tail protein
MAASAVAYFVGSAAGELATSVLLEAGLNMGSAALISSATAIGGFVGLATGAATRQALLGGPDNPDSVSAARSQGIMLNTSSTVEALPIIYGTRKVGGTRALLEVSGTSNDYLHLVIALGEGEIDGTTEIYLDDVNILDARYGAYAYGETNTGTDTQAASASLLSYLGGKWTAAHTGSGVAYLYVRCQYSPSVFNGLPTVTALVRGRKVYDPRSNLLGKTAINTWTQYITGTAAGTASLVMDATYGNVLRLTKTAGANADRFGFNLSVPTGFSGSNYAGSVLFKVNVAGTTGPAMYVDAAKSPSGLVVAAAQVDGSAVGVWKTGILAGAGALAGSGQVYCWVEGPIGSSFDVTLPQLNNGTVVLAFMTNASGSPILPTTAHSNNPALCLRDYLTNARYGRGIASAYIDDASFTAAANHCDELVAVPTGTQKRYTCDGVVDVNRSAFDNTRSLLSACRGMLVNSAGVYKLVIDKATAATFAFTEDNIVGDWSIVNPGRRSKFNRVSAGIFNPANNWQPDLAIADSAAYRTLDNNRLSEGKLDLPFTADTYRAQQLAGLHLKQSRFGIVARFTALQEGLRAEVGDVVTITHTTPGWVAKLFRVMQITISSEDDVEVVAQEYDATVYNLDTLATITGAAASNLPNVLAVGVPGVPMVTETLYQTTGSAGLKTRATIASAASADAFVDGYLFEYKLSNASTWTVLPKVATPTVDIADLLPAVYDFRVRAENLLGARSSYASATKELLGLTAAPANVANFAVTKVGGVAYGSWTLTTDLDVRLGGKLVVRHSTQTSGATWNDGIILEEFNGDAIMGVLPLITGTYMAKFVDSTANYSASMASFVATEGLVTGYTTVATSTQAPTFTGTKTNVAVVSSALQLDSASLWDAYAGNIDTWTSVDTLGQLSPTGTYLFDTYVDMTTVATRRLEASVKALSSDNGDTVDLRTTAIDDWSDMDGSVINDCDVTLYHACTDTDPAGSPTWTAWAPFFVADVTCRAMKFKLEYVSANPQHQIAVSTLTVRVKS